VDDQPTLRGRAIKHFAPLIICAGVLILGIRCYTGPLTDIPARPVTQSPPLYAIAECCNHRLNGVRNMSSATFLTGLSTVEWDKWIVAAFTIAIALYTRALNSSTRGLWQESRIASNIAEKAANAALKSASAAAASIRPWIRCEIRLTSPLVYTSQGDANIDVEVTLTNVGHSPAIAVRGTVFFTVRESRRGDPLAQLKRAEGSDRELHARKNEIGLPHGELLGEVGHMLMPGDSFEWKDTVLLPRSEIDFVTRTSSEHPAPFWPLLCGLVSYGYQMTDERVHTAFVREITARTNHVPTYIRQGQRIERNSLEIIRHSLYSDYVT
jgi:hypothetical protein